MEAYDARDSMDLARRALSTGHSTGALFACRRAPGVSHHSGQAPHPGTVFHGGDDIDASLMIQVSNVLPRT